MIDFLPVGIGAKTLATLTQQANENGISLFRALKEHMPAKFMAKDIFSGLFMMNQKKSEYKVSEFLKSLLKRSGYISFLEEKGEQDRLLNIDELLEFIKKWETENPDEPISDLMDRMSLSSAADEEKKKEGETQVFLLTMHNAKGLEFNTVFVAGINNTYMPFFLRKGRGEIEEERRLFYVASTRAIEQLVVSVGSDKPSRFVPEINQFLYTNAYSVDGLFDYHAESNRGRIPEAGVLQETVQEKFLEHPVFGKGLIINAIDKEKFIVNFEKKGEKTIDTSIVPVKFL